MPGELRIFALQSPQIIINELAPQFEERTGYRITQLMAPGDMPVHFLRRIANGEAFDAAFLIPTLLDQLADQGKILPETRAGFLRVPIGVAVRAGAPKPNISS